MFQKTRNLKMKYKGTLCNWEVCSVVFVKHLCTYILKLHALIFYIYQQMFYNIIVCIYLAIHLHFLNILSIKKVFF